MDNQILQQPTIQPPTVTNAPQNPLPSTPSPIKSAKIFLIVGAFLLFLLIGGGGYYLGVQKNNIPKQPFQQETSVVSPTIEAMQSSPPTTQPADITWKTQNITIEEETMIGGKQTITMELKMPSDWNFQAIQITPSPNDLIKNCAKYITTSKDNLFIMTLQPICSAYQGKGSSWPNDAVIVLQKQCSGNDGPHTCYRVRFASNTTTYSYADASTDPNRPLDTTKDQIGDAIIIKYAPPNESKDDFFFIPANLTTTYTGDAKQKENYLSIADKIAASITLR